jgi:predicted amidohydrolase
MKVSCIQFEVKEGDVKRNLEKVMQMIEESSSDLYVLPELWSCGLVFERIHLFCKYTFAILKELKNLSLSKKVAIIGSLPEEEEGRIYNTAYLVDSGQIKAKYRKVHLFSPMGEDKFLVPGNSICVLSKIGFAICYDIRFDIIKCCAEKGAQVVAVPAAWPSVRIHHLSILLKARALENSVFILCANQTKGDFGGNSMIVGPEGEVIAQLKRKEGIVSANIELTLAEEAKRKRCW